MIKRERVCIQLTGLISLQICACPNSGLGFLMSYVVVFLFIQWFEVICCCSLCWYWWNCLPPLFKLSLYFVDHCLSHFFWITDSSYPYTGFDIVKCFLKLYGFKTFLNRTCEWHLDSRTQLFSHKNQEKDLDLKTHTIWVQISYAYSNIIQSIVYP